MSRCLASLLGFLWMGASAAGAQAPIRDLRPTVILISIDGMRHDYPEKAQVTNLHWLIRNGTRARGLVPVFPSKTFPNHYTLVTGLLPANHGIISNHIWDPRYPERFGYNQREEAVKSRWWGGEPIWNTVQKQGGRAAAMFWPGSEAEISGSRPAFSVPYDSRFPHEERVQRVLGWLDLPAPERPTFLTLYFSAVDTAGHDRGPDSPEVVKALDNVDRALGQLLDGLRARKILEKVHIIVTADHGMVATSPRRSIFVDDLLDMRDVEVIEWSPVFMVRSRSGNDENIYRALAGARRPLSVYRKAELPERLRLRESLRVPPVVAIADEGWNFTTRGRAATRRNPELGTHGYDNSLRSMHAFFVAYGPSVRRGTTVDAFSNLHVYELMCHLLRVKPAKNDGSLEAVRHLLAGRNAAVAAGQR